jgi:indole-3-glycerol phosphate synthase
VYEARYNGASAILLIMAILTDAHAQSLMQLASTLDLDCLVEVHDQDELERALDLGAEIIGINNRNLKTFEVRLETCQDLIPRIPSGKVIVAESGIQTADDMRLLAELGAQAVLVGEIFMVAEDIGAQVDALRSYQG